MKVYFRSKKLQKVCSEQREMAKQFGKDMAGKLQQRLAELGAADSLADISYLPPARCHELSGSLKGHFSVDLVHPYRLLFVPADDPVPVNDFGGIDRNLVRSIEIVEIRDTH
ncbi:MAG: type II toxin-antitoxin system RelE/ParE family toxin [Candidatus Hydrogenedentes bacterium]|nr:type II toxin-antitoxin system RelE/ParE family toxin [Candidatus Hydrogenedentota bacterium]